MFYCGTYVIYPKKGKAVMPRNLAVSGDMEWCLMIEKGKDGAKLPKLVIRNAMTDSEKAKFTTAFSNDGYDVVSFGKVAMKNRFFIIPEAFINCFQAENEVDFSLMVKGIISFIKIYKESDFEKRLDFSLEDFINMEASTTDFTAESQIKDRFICPVTVENSDKPYKIYDAAEMDKLICAHEDMQKSTELLVKAMEYFKTESED
ncbi:MAG: hypothetical protein R3Y32_00100 [Bacillota bacterium]